MPSKTASDIREIYPGSEADRKIRSCAGQKSHRFFFVIALTFLVSIPVFIIDTRTHSKPLASIRRDGYGGISGSAFLRAVSEEGIEESITVDVLPRRYTQEELDVFSQRLDDQLWTMIRSDNTDRDEVSQDLDLRDHYEGCPFEFSWKSDRPLILAGSGVINKEKVKEQDADHQGIDVRLCATLKYDDHTEDKYLYVTVTHESKTEESLFKDDLIESIKASDEASRTCADQILPSTAQGHRVVFYDDAVNRGWAVLFAGIVGAFLMMAGKDRKIRDEADRRRQQMASDHPKILNQYMLYYLAGMNPRAIWSEICRRYEEERGGSVKNRRYAYEEMINTRNRINEGCGELAAYDEFAQRCDSRYRTFVSFVKQSVVKGGSELEHLLYEEIEKASREQSNRIKVQAGEAQTKLLLPMFMMLAVVLAIVMIPAFIGLNG